jgi:ribosomal RNA-processing protein 8
VSTDRSVVIEADIARLPLSNNIADVSVFCLSLMGTNWPEFIEEGVRILKKK